MKTSPSLLVAMMLLLPVGVFAQVSSRVTSEEENKALRERVDRLEADLEQLKRALEEKPAAPPTQEKAQAAPTQEKPSIRSKFNVDLYGFIKTDAAYMTAHTDDAGNYARWVRSEEVNKNDDQFSLTARESRFGLMFQGPDVASMKTSARAEIDFYEGGDENKNRPMMRHAYLQAEWPKLDIALLAGQTSDLFSPLVPETLNYTVGWWVGNIGYRRPQIRLSKGFDVGQDVRMLVQVAAARTIGDVGPFNSGPGDDTGKDAGFPTMQARYSLSFPFLAGKKATAGVSGHYGEEEYNVDAEGKNANIATWSANGELDLPLSAWANFKGEVWTGENVDAYLGGVGQGMVIETSDGAFVNANGAKTTATFVRDWPVRSTGGWANLVLGPWRKWRLSTGFSIDDPDDSDIPNDDGRTWNGTCWLTPTWDLNEALRVGLEVSYWKTEYKRIADGDAVRIQNSFIYRF
jgi:hypothetical protein